MPEESTTPDLVERMRQRLDARNRGDLEAVMGFYAPDAVLDMSPIGMGIFEGRGAVRGFLEDWSAPYEDYEQDVEEISDLGGGVVLTILLQRGTLTGSRGVVEVRYAAVAAWVHGVIARHTNYKDIDEGRAAAERLAESSG